MNMDLNIPITPSNAANLAAAFALLDRLVRARIGGEEFAPGGSLRLDFFDDGSALGDFIRARRPAFDEYVTLLLALAPHVRPTLIETAIRESLPREGDFPEIGGRRSADSRILMPTGETATFLLAGDDLEGRLEIHNLFGPDHWFARDGILRLEEAAHGEPFLSGRIVIARDWLERFTTGRPTAPPFSSRFPAKRISTALDWDELVLAPPVREQIEELHRWARHGRASIEAWGMERRLRPGYRALFHGPSGTGKTLTATLLGKSTGREVYRVDLSTVVSKYIGETEKNLSSLFDAAENRDWILFFDEADALFGKRTGVKDAHDRYANQEVSYLLQRVEEFDGLAILASNFRANIDDAFLRRFNAIIRFPMPTPAERCDIWRRALPERERAGGRATRLSDAMSKFELTGGSIVNVIQFALVEAVAAGRDRLSLADALKGAQREIEKEGKVFANLLAGDVDGFD
jgi:hypothetical protein